MYAELLLSGYMENSKEMLLLSAMEKLHKLKEIMMFRFTLPERRKGLKGFSNSEFWGDQDDRRSALGYIFMLGLVAIS